MNTFHANDEIKNEENVNPNLVAAAAVVFPMGRDMLKIAFAGKYKELRKKKGFDKFPSFSVDKPKDLPLERKFGKGKEFNLYMTVFGDILLMLFDSLKDVPDSGSISAQEVINYKFFLPKLFETSEDYGFGLRLKNKKGILEWEHLRDMSVKDIAVLIPNAIEAVLVISKK